MENQNMHHSSSHLPPTNPILKPNNPHRHTQIMDNLKKTIIKLANSDPNKPLSPEQITLIERRLLETFPDFHTPTHPTYASMIHRAIVDLYEQDGSSENSISEYIMSNYEDLPWAHKRYLSHHLEKLCEDGEIVCTSSKCYTIPGLIQPNSRSLKLRIKIGKERNEILREEGNLVGEKVREVNENQNEETQMMFEKGKVKRRKRSLDVHQEDNEIRQIGVLGREENVIGNSEILAIEPQNELLELEDNEIRQIGVLGREENVIGNSEIPAIEPQNGLLELEPQTQVMEATIERSPSKECQNEVTTEVVPSNHDQTEDKTEPRIPLVPSTVQVTSETLHLDHDNNGKELSLALVEGHCSLNSEPNFEDDAHRKSPKKSVLKGTDSNLCANELMIVPFEGNTPRPVMTRGRKKMLERMDPIVCGLTAEGIELPKWKKQGYQRKKRSKADHENPPLLLENSIPASPALPGVLNMLEHEHLHYDSPMSGLETELEKQNLYLEQSQPSGPQELMPTEDENLPLKEVLVKCGKRRKLSLGATTSKAPEELSNTENPAKMMLLREGNQEPQISEFIAGKVDMQPQSQDQDRSPYLEQATEENMRPSSPTQDPNRQKEDENQKNQSEMGERGSSDLDPLKTAIMEEKVPLNNAQCQSIENPGKEELSNAKNPAKMMPLREENEEPQISDFIAGKVDMQPQSQDQESSPYLEQATEENMRPSSQTQDPNRQKEDENQKNQSEMGERGSSDLDPPKTAIMEEKVPLNNAQCQSIEKPGKKLKRPGRGRPPKAKLTQDRLSEIAGDQGDSQCQASHHDPELHVATFGEGNLLTLHQNSQQLIKKPKGRGRGRPPKQKERLSEPTTDSIVEEEPSAICQNDQQETQGRKSDGQINLGHVASDNPTKEQEKQPIEESLLSEKCQSDRIEDQQGQSQNEVGLQETKQPEKKRRGRPPKQSGETKDDVAIPLNLLPQHKKKDGRGRPRKQKGATEEQKEPYKLATHQCPPKKNKKPKKDEQPKRAVRGRPRKQIGPTEDDVAAPCNQEGEGKSDPEAHSVLEASSVLGHLDEKESQKQETNGQISCRDNQPSQEQKEHKQDNFPNKPPKQSQSEIYGHSKSKLVTTPSENQPCQEQDERQCEHHEEKQEQLKGQFRPSKAKSAKSTAIQVPLSSKDQLRSRMKKSISD